MGTLNKARASLAAVGFCVTAWGCTQLLEWQEPTLYQAPDATADALGGPPLEGGDGHSNSGDGPCSTNLQNDPHNCGLCGHSCLGSVCVQGACAQRNLFDASVQGLTASAGAAFWIGTSSQPPCLPGSNDAGDAGAHDAEGGIRDAEAETAPSDASASAVDACAPFYGQSVFTVPPGASAPQELVRSRVPYLDGGALYSPWLPAPAVSNARVFTWGDTYFDVERAWAPLVSVSLDGGSPAAVLPAQELGFVSDLCPPYSYHCGSTVNAGPMPLAYDSYGLSLLFVERGEDGGSGPLIQVDTQTGAFLGLSEDLSVSAPLAFDALSIFAVGVDAQGYSFLRFDRLGSCDGGAACRISIGDLPPTACGVRAVHGSLRWCSVEYDPVGLEYQFILQETAGDSEADAAVGTTRFLNRASIPSSVSPPAVLTDDGVLFWNSGQILLIPASGGPASSLATTFGSVGALVADEIAVYWTDGQGLWQEVR